MEQLTQGSVSRIFGMNGTDDDPSFTPTLQIINVRKVTNSGNQDRFRVVFSDGTKYIQGLLTTQVNQMVYDDILQQFSIFKLTKFVKNVVANRNIVVILNLEVTGGNPGAKLGDPSDIANGAGAGTENVAPAAAAAQSMYGNNNNTKADDNGNNSAKPAGGGSNNPYGGGASRNNNGFGGNPYSGGGGNNAPIQRTTPGGSAFTPIGNLNMYQNRWTIRARVTNRSDIRTWSNARGEGSLFSVDMLDSSGVDIRGTFFKEAVDKYYNMVEEGKVFTFSGGRIKVANMQYNTCKSNFEITFDQNSEIHLVDDSGDIQSNLYEFVGSIAEIENTEANKNVDVLAIVKAVGEPSTLVSKKSGNELTKCELTIVDDSGVEISVTLWGADKANAAPQEYGGNPVVAFRRCRVSDYGGKSLSLSGSATVNPGADVGPGVQRLQQWWNNGGSTGAGTKSLSSGRGGGGAVAPFNERQDIGSIKGNHMGHGEKPDWLTFKATISFIKKDKEGGAWYPACANAGDPCKNMFKVTQTTDGAWFCDKCQGTYPEPVRRYIFSATVEDDTSSTWVTFFNSQAEALLGGETTANQAYTNFMDGEGNQDGYDSLFYKAQSTEWILKCKVKSELVNEEQRVKTSVFAMEPVNYVKESENMLQALEKWS